MNKDFYKFLALGAAAMYVYKVVQENGGTLMGNSEGIRLTSDGVINRVVPHLKIQNPKLRNAVAKGARNALAGLLGEPRLVGGSK